MRPQHRFLVQEAGFWRPGSIAEMARVLQPTVAVVTALGGDHRKAVGGSRERLAEEKGKLVEALPAGGLVVLDADDPLIAGMAALRPTARAVFFGRSERADLRLLDATAAWPDRLRLRLSYRGEVFSLATRFVSEVNALAVMAAMLTALELGVDRRQCEAVVAGFEPLFDKLSVHAGQNGEWYVLDATKGSHQGLEACLGFLAAARAPRKTVVFGTLADYAGASRSAYHKAARLALACADRVFFTGANAFRPRRLATGEFADRILMVEDPARLLSELRQSVVPGELIYVKAALVDQLASVFSSALAVKPPTIRKRQRTILG
jgi:UDP-N-acetylmuramoyl-tripeptide--D-alanyl-D-alanine ligase